MGDWGRDPFRLGNFVVEPKRNLVSGPEGSTVLQPRIVDVLCFIAGRHGEVVSREEIIDRVWGVEFGADESLTRAISQLRKAFSDSRENPQIIETIAKRGYRLVPPPLPADGEPSAPAAGSPTATRRPRWLWPLLVLAALVLASALWWSLRDSAAAAVSERTGIVLQVAPFASAEPGLGTSLSDDLSGAFARNSLVRVRTAGPPERPDGMDYLIRGTVGRDGGFIRFDWQLIEAGSKEVVRSGQYRFPGGHGARAEAIDVIGGEILLPLLRSVKARLARRPILELEPWALTLLVTWVPGDEVRPAGPPSEDSYWLQKRALELDPDFAPAHALFAELAGYHALFHPPASSAGQRARAQRHAERAIELAPYDPEVLYQLGLYNRFIGQRERSRALFERVLELQPGHPLARLDLAYVKGQCSDGAEAAIADIERQAGRFSQSNPLRWVALSHLANLYLTRGDFGRAQAAALRARQIVPVTLTGMTAAAAEAALGNRDAAVALLAEHRREWPEMSARFFADHVISRWCLGGKRTQAVQHAFSELAAATR